MKSIIIKSFCFTMALATLATSCKKNYTNPSAATADQVFSSPQGLTGVVVGLQRIYSSNRPSNLYNRVSADGLLTLQDSVVNQGNTAEYQLSIGQVDGTNTMMAGLWISSNKIIYDANKVIENAQNVPDKGYASGLVAYATIFKALALGDLSMFWEKIPASIGTNVAFEDRMQGFTRAITAIDAAIAAINANAISASFIANVPAGIDIINTLHALKARYSLFIGNNAQALAEANMVDLTKKSTLNFSTVNLNPIFETVTSTNNVYVPKDSSMGLPPALKPDPNDKRFPFYISTNATPPKLRIAGFAGTSTAAWPIYLPGEMTLIKAEAYTRNNDLTNGLIELNKVITKKPANDPFGVGADLPPIPGPLTKDELLTEIYRQRAIELYFSGLRMEDMRRFGRPNSEKRRNFLPYPFQERDNNPNTPTDPTF